MMPLSTSNVLMSSNIQRFTESFTFTYLSRHKEKRKTTPPGNLDLLFNKDHLVLLNQIDLSLLQGPRLIVSEPYRHQKQLAKEV
jgi:hypothetical protein